jgi:hypothetical protein
VDFAQQPFSVPMISDTKSETDLRFETSEIAFVDVICHTFRQSIIPDNETISS